MEVDAGIAGVGIGRKRHFGVESLNIDPEVVSASRSRAAPQGALLQA